MDLIIGFFIIIAFLFSLAIFRINLPENPPSFADALIAIIFIGTSSALAITYLGLESSFLLPIIVAIIIIGLTLFFRKGILASLKRKSK